MAKEPEPRITCVNGAVEESCISQQPAGGVSFAISGAPGTAAAVFFCFSRVSACCSDSNGCLFPTSLLAFFPTARNAYYIYIYKAGCLAGMFEWHLPPIFLFLPPVFGQLRRSDAPAECDAIGPMPQGEKRRGFWTRPVLGGHRKDCCLML